MSSALYLLGTTSVWLGVGLLLRAVFLMVRWRQAVGLDQASTGRAMLVAAIAGAAAILIGLMPLRPAAEGGWPVPLVWPFMPFAAWGSVVCGVMALGSVGRAMLSLPGEFAARLPSAALWLAASVAFGAWFQMGGDEVQILRGTIVARPSSLLLVAALAAGAVVTMAWVGRSTRQRGWGRTWITHAALIVGSMVFGLPFAWLAITSFKEDVDMASPDGIVWVPRVQITVPYNDPDDPLMEGVYEGTTVEGSIMEFLPNGAVKLDILKPLGLRGLTLHTRMENLKEIPKQIPLVDGDWRGSRVRGKVVRELDDGQRRVEVMTPPSLAGQQFTALPSALVPVRKIGLRWQNYTDALEFLPMETQKGLVYLKNTLFLVILNVLGTLLSCSLVAYAFSRLRFPGRETLFAVLLSTMMLPAAVTLLPQFLIFRSFGWIDTLYPLWVPAFFASAFNVFLLRQFLMSVPMELEDAAKIDGCGYLRAFWSVMLPQIKPALAVIAIWTFMGTWNNFMGPLIYINSPEFMPIAYAVQLFQGDRGGEPGMLMAFTTLSMLPVLALFFVAQRFFIEGVTLSGMGGR